MICIGTSKIDLDPSVVLLLIVLRRVLVFPYGVLWLFTAGLLLRLILFNVCVL